VAEENGMVSCVKGSFEVGVEEIDAFPVYFCVFEGYE
jgi:hypothetical protein